MKRVVDRRAELKATSWTRAYSKGSTHEGGSARSQQSNSYLYATTHGSISMAIELHEEGERRGDHNEEVPRDDFTPS